MITSNTFYSFGGKVAVIQTPTFNCMISTAKEGFFKKQSTRFLICDEKCSNREVIAVGTIDEFGMKGVPLKETLETLFKRFKENGVAVGEIFGSI